VPPHHAYIYKNSVNKKIQINWSEYLESGTSAGFRAGGEPCSLLRESVAAQSMVRHSTNFGLQQEIGHAVNWDPCDHMLHSVNKTTLKTQSRPGPISIVEMCLEGNTVTSHQCLVSFLFLQNMWQAERCVCADMWPTTQWKRSGNSPQTIRLQSLNIHKLKKWSNRIRDFMEITFVLV